MSGPTQKPHTTDTDRPAGFPPGSRGWCIRLACELEATAAKPGNVHPGTAFADLTHAELLAAGAAIAPAFDAAAGRRLGATILAAVSASRRVTRSNANLGIVLVAAPLAAVPDGEPPGPAAVARVLAGLVPDDAHDCWEAIKAARPGGMGTRDRWDIAGAPPEDLLAAMRSAAPHDQIARLWARGYEPLFAGPVTDLEQELLAGRDLGDAIVRAFLRQLAREPDSLIARKHGPRAAERVSARAAATLAVAPEDWPDATRAFERDLLTGRGFGDLVVPEGGVRPGTINPGTTADLVAAALYVLLVTGRLQEPAGPVPAVRSQSPCDA